MQYIKSIKQAKSINELFEVVKDIVLEFSGYSRSGIDLVAADLGSENSHIGGFYKYHNNSITLNTRLIKVVYNSNPKIINYYIFHILLHEYIHALGVYDEARTRRITYIISSHYFGPNHTLTKLAKNMSRFFPQTKPKERIKVQYVEESIFEDFDKQISEFMNQIFSLMDSFFI